MILTLGEVHRGPGRQQDGGTALSYVIATNERRLRWYQFPDLSDPSTFVLHEVLDTGLINSFVDKAAAQAIAQAANINGNYRFVRL